MKPSLMTVVETNRFIRDASQLMPEAERMNLVTFIAANPESGDLIPEDRAECDGETRSNSRCGLFEQIREEMMKKSKMAGDRRTKAKRKQAATVGQRVIEGLEQAIAWSRGERGGVRVTVVTVPEVDVRKVRRQMGLSQTQFATKFGFPPATLRNWEQGRASPDAPTRVLLAVIAKHPEAVEDVLGKAS